MGIFTRTIFTEIEIAAPAASIWKILTDFSRYGEWNAMLPKVEGPLILGGHLQIQIKLSGGPVAPYVVQITRLSEGQALGWRGRFRFPGLFYGDHHFEIEAALGGRSKVVQRETFSGLLAPFLWRNVLNVKMRSEFHKMNQALRERAEAGARGI